MPEITASHLSFGRFELRPDLRELRVDGTPAKLGARAFDLLAVLAERRERTVSKNELLDLVWPGLVVEENNLQVHVSALRKLLGPASIATIPGRGYRFTAAPTAAEPVVVGAVPPPMPAPPAPARHNLPAATSALHGRDGDLADLRALLADHRLVTLVGAGGIGKTRLAQSAAVHALPLFRDGVWLVELAPLADPALVLDSVARVLGVPLPLAGGADALAERLDGRHLLLVLDNCEHLLDSTATLTQALLRGAPGLRILATSQQPLRLADEHVLRLGTLAVPLDGATATSTAADGDALTLFQERARAAQPRFALNDGNRAAAAEICRRLDGIPLAIELAAARIPLLGLEGLRQRLDDRFRLLTGGNRLAPRRQQTLHAALEWSHGQLADAEQAVFRRLGVFKGSFGLDAAQAVAADAGLDGWGVLEALSGLVDKSLVSAEPGELPRYRLFESPRAFALEQLAAAGETAATQRAHAQAVLVTFARSAEQRWTPSRADDARRRLADLDNLRAALVWASGADGDAVLHVALAGASAWFWSPVSLSTEGQNCCARALAVVGPAVPRELESALQIGFGRLAHQFDAQAELAALRRGAELCRQTGDLQGAYYALALLAKKLVWRHEPEVTERAIAEAAALWSPGWPPTLREPLLQARTYAFEAAGRPADGQPLMEELVALMRQHGDELQLNRALAELAESLFVQGKAEETIAARRELAARCSGQDSNEEHINAGNLAAVLAYAGRHEEGLALAREVSPALRRIDRLSQQLDHWALLALQDGRPLDAARAIGCSDAALAATGFGREMGELRAHDQVLQELRRQLPAPELERLLAEGAVLDTDTAVRLALGG